MPLWGGKSGDRYTQETFHVVVLITSLICVPILLFPKPIVDYFSQKHKNQNYVRLSDEMRLVRTILTKEL